MPSVPPKTLEAIVGFFLPPVRREEVLGDLCEKYTGSIQYIVLAIRVVPCVILSRVRRTADAQIVMMEALLIYASYLAAAWYADRTLLMSQWGFFRLVAPTVLAVAFMVLEDAWAPVRKRSPLRLTGEVALGTLFAFLLMVRRLPGTLNLVGASASLLLVSAVRILFRPEVDKPQSATGPAVWNEPAVMPRNTRNIYYALAAASVLIVISLAARPRNAPIFVIVALVMWVGFSRARKE
jgi:hypothetical protein